MSSTLEESEKRTTANNTIQIDTQKVAINHGFDGPIIIDDGSMSLCPMLPLRRGKKKWRNSTSPSITDHSGALPASHALKSGSSNA